MQIVLIILSVGLLGCIIYFAVSSKSSRLLKIAALIALGLIALSIGVCSIFLIRGPEENPEAVPFTVFQEVSEPARKNNTPAILIFFVIFILVLGMITVIALRGQKKKEAAEQKKTTVPAAAPKEFNQEKSSGDNKEERFDIGFD